MRKLFNTITSIALLGALVFSSNAYAGDPDINDDGEVNMLDISLISSCLYQDPLAPTNPVCGNVDTNDDGYIDFDDFYFVADHFGEVGFPIPSPDISGADVNNNGIWDYVDSYIDTKYPHTSDKRSVIQKVAITFQTFLTDASDQTKSLKNDEALGQEMACLWEVMPEDEVRDARDITAVIVNTQERSNAYLQATEQLSGHRTRLLPCKDTY